MEEEEGNKTEQRVEEEPTAAATRNPVHGRRSCSHQSRLRRRLEDHRRVRGGEGRERPIDREEENRGIKKKTLTHVQIEENRGKV